MRLCLSPSIFFSGNMSPTAIFSLPSGLPVLPLLFLLVKLKVGRIRYLFSGLSLPLVLWEIGLLFKRGLVLAFLLPSLDKGVSGLELAVVGEGCSDQNVIVVEGSKKKRSITKALEEKATVASTSTLRCLLVILGILLAVQTPLLLVVKDLRSKNAYYLEELSMLRRVAASVEESRKQISEEFDGLQPRLKKLSI
nr:hypothetical protein [Tanacetum cinerariifolium]